MNKPIFKFALRKDIIDNKEFLPKQANEKDTGYDVRAAMPDRKPLVIKPFEHVKIPLGIRGFCPDGWWYEIKPRSSTFAKKNLHALYGTIDETYEGELVFACQYIPSFTFTHLLEDFLKQTITINFGDAIGQLIPIKRQEMEIVGISNEELDIEYANRNAVRKTGGFGSTGS